MHIIRKMLNALVEFEVYVFDNQIDLYKRHVEFVFDTANEEFTLNYNITNHVDNTMREYMFAKYAMNQKLIITTDSYYRIVNFLVKIHRLNETLHIFDVPRLLFAECNMSNIMWKEITI